MAVNIAAAVVAGLGCGAWLAHTIFRRRTVSLGSPYDQAGLALLTMVGMFALSWIGVFLFSFAPHLGIIRLAPGVPHLGGTAHLACGARECPSGSARHGSVCGSRDTPIDRMGASCADAVLAFVFAASWFVTGAMAAHLPNLLERCGATALQAISAGALVGPAQVAARFLEFMLLRRVHPVVSARLATMLHPAGAVMLTAFGAPMAAVFALLHGAGNGLLTIARGTVPLALFGPVGYGHRFRLGALCLLALIALLVLRTGPVTVSPLQSDPSRSA